MVFIIQKYTEKGERKTHTPLAIVRAQFQSGFLYTKALLAAVLSAPLPSFGDFAKFNGMKLCLFPKKTDEEKNKALTDRKNAKSAAAFAAIPYGERVVFVPHCMRNIKKCRAKEMGSYYICAECGACKIGEISKKSKELGYKALYILKGGKAVKKLSEELKPKAVLGVACYFEGVIGMEESEKHGLTAQFTPLLKDGCVDTDVDLEQVFAALRKISK
jgi:hypothetical protein